MICDNCGHDIPPELSQTLIDVRTTVNGLPIQEWPERITNEARDAFQGKNALHLAISGGYGEFIDTIQGAIHCVLCHDCGHKLVAFLPFLAERLRGGHPHNEPSEMVDAVDWDFRDYEDPSLP